MADNTKPTSIRPQFSCDATWPPSSWQTSVLYNQHFGLPPLLDSRDISWMASLFRKLGSSSWPGYTRASNFMSMKVHRELSEGVSEVYVEQSKWTVSLDVNHFAPTELMVRTQSGLLVIEGKHEERQDEHGYISRCFVRKYKLPLGTDAETIQSCLSRDGILTVEAKLTSVPQPADVDIPVQVEAPTVEDKQEDGLQREETAEEDGIPQAETDASQPPAPSGPEEKPEEESVAQQTEDRLHPTAPEIGREEEAFPERAAETADEQSELEQQEVKKEEISEENFEDAGEAPEDLQETAEQLEAAQTPETEVAQFEEKPEAVADGEDQEVMGEGEQQEKPATGQTQLEFQPQVVVEEKLQAE